MALTACADCGKEISTMAAACPSCGRRGPARTSARRVRILLLVVFVPVAIWAYFAIRDYERAAQRARDRLGHVGSPR